MGFETVNAAWHPHPAKGFAPSDGIRLVARDCRKAIGRFRPAADEAVNLFLNVDEWLFHCVTP
jgi:hypothetical protein